MTKMLYTLPELTGSEKQIAWAQKIRKTQYTMLDTYVNNHIRSTPEQKEVWVECFNWIFSQTDARFWIDRRDSVKGDQKAMIIEARRSIIAAQA
jgi:hypothetical protein